MGWDVKILLRVCLTRLRLRFIGFGSFDACEETMLAPGGLNPPPPPLEEEVEVVLVVLVVLVGQGEWELAVGS